MNPLLELADRVEAARAGDRELAEGVYCALGLARFVEGAFDAYRAPDYLSSLDAATTLVPRGWAWLRKDFSTMTCVQLTGTEKGWAKHLDGMGATPAAALTAASLRAIASMGSSG